MNSISSNFVGVSGGLLMSVIAFSIVFLVIVGLMFVMMGVKTLATAIDSAGKAAPASSTVTPAAPSAAASTPVVTVAEDDSELAAVISAAIAAVCGGSARVIAFSPANAQGGNSTLWRASGRFQNSEGFDG